MAGSFKCFFHEDYFTYIMKMSLQINEDYQRKRISRVVFFDYMADETQ